MEVTTASMDAVDLLVDLWVDLATDQRDHGSHLLGDRNRTAVREAIVQRIVSKDVLVARRDGVIVGFVMTAVDSGRYEQDVTRGLIENIYVRPADRNRGIGSELLRAAESTLTEAGADVIALEAMAANEKAKRFYRDHGYAPHRIELEKSTESDTL